MEDAELSRKEIELPTERLDLHGERLDFQQKRLDDLETSRLQGISNQIREAAEFKALQTMVLELAVHAGLSAQHVEDCFRERVQYYRDFLLRKAEDIDPSIGSRIDDRNPLEIPTDEAVRPLFPRDQEV